jgi:MFS family permease
VRNVLRRPDFRLLFGGLVASMIGESILLLALAIWVKDLTGSDGMAGATIFAIVAPLALAPVMGWIVDRFRRRQFLVVANLASAAVLTPLFAVRGRDDVWIIFLVGALYGLSYIAIVSALNSLIKQIVPDDLLADANGALQTVKQGLRLIGPLVGAALYTAVGGWAVAVVAAAGFLLAATAIGLLRVRETKPTPSQLHWLAEATSGMRHLAAEPALRRAVVGVALAVLVLGFTESLIFAYVDQGLHRPPGFVGVLVSVQGVGGLLGGLTAARVVRRFGEVGTTAIGILLFAAESVILAAPNLALAGIAMVSAGFGLPLAIVGFNTLMQRRTPAAILGRVSAATEALISGPQALSIAVGAILVSIVDYRLLFVMVGLVMFAAGAYLWRGRRLSSPAGPRSARAARGAVGRRLRLRGTTLRASSSAPGAAAPRASSSSPSGAALPLAAPGPGVAAGAEPGRPS